MRTHAYASTRLRIAQVCVKKSNSAKITFLCYTALQATKRNNKRKEEPIHARFACAYKAVLRKSKAKSGLSCKLPWALSQRTTWADMQHSSNCTSRAKISLREAIVHTKKTNKGRAPNTILNTRNKIVIDNQIPKSAVPLHIAYQVRLLHARQSNKNYKVNKRKTSSATPHNTDAQPVSLSQSLPTSAPLISAPQLPLTPFMLYYQQQLYQHYVMLNQLNSPRE